MGKVHEAKLYSNFAIKMIAELVALKTIYLTLSCLYSRLNFLHLNFWVVIHLDDKFSADNFVLTPVAVVKRIILGLITWNFIRHSVFVIHTNF
jgi:hypothetical protein